MRRGAAVDDRCVYRWSHTSPIEERGHEILVPGRRFSFETLRTAGFAPYGGADLNEVPAIAGDSGEDDEASWREAWKATAHRLAGAPWQALASEHHVSAREALLRASDYYGTAAAFLLEKPAHQTMFDWLGRTLVASSASRAVVGR